MRRWAAGAVVAVLLLLPIGAGAQQTAVSPCPDPNQVVQLNDWIQILKPAELERVTTFAVDPHDHRVVIATDSRRVLRTIDGGCNWARAYHATAPAGLPGGTGDFVHAEPIVRQVLVPGSGTRTVLALDAAGTTAARTPLVLVSDDADTWRTASGLPAVGGPVLLRAAPSDPDRLYLTLTGVSSLQASRDGGQSWSQRAGGAVDRLVVDPRHPDELWGVRWGAVVHSTDAGGSWSTVTTPITQTLVDLAVQRRDGAAALVVAARTTSGRFEERVHVWRSLDAGSTWEELPQPYGAAPLGSLAVGPASPDDIFLTTRQSFNTASAVLRYDAFNKTWRDIDHLQFAPLDSAVAMPDELATVYFRKPRSFANSTEAIVAYVTPPPPAGAPPGQPPDVPIPPADPVTVEEPIPPPPAACLANGRLRPPDPKRFEVGTLTPNPATVALEPGRPKTLPYRLSLPAVPGKLDLYFLLDTSGSMGSARDGVVCGLERIVSQLTARGIDVHIGLGEFNDAYRLRYRRIVDIGPPGAALQRGLRSIELRGGEEPHRSALYQTATGAGLRTPQGGVVIPPNQQANFRPDALKVVMQVTDEPWTLTTWQEPSPADVIAALNAKGIEHVGIHVYGAGQGSAFDSGILNDVLVRQQLEQWSTGTTTFAPVGGVDCDGDNRPDVPPGAPLVCSVKRSGIEGDLGGTLVNVLLALNDDRTIELEATETSGTSVVVAPPSHRVNVRTERTGANALRFDVTFLCVRAQEGRTYPVRLEAFSAGDLRIATADASVVCGEQPLPPLPPPPEVVAPPGLLVLPAPAPPPVVPVPIVANAPAQAPATATGTSTANVSVAQIAGAPAQQVMVPGVALAPLEERTRVVTVEARFTALRVGAAAAMAFGFGWAMRSRTSHAPATVRRRRRGSR